MSENQHTRGPWPAGHRAALLLVIHVSGTADAAIAEGGYAPLTGADYTATGLQRLVSSLTDLDVAATTIWTANGLATSPQLVRVAADNGHEIAISVIGEEADRLQELRDTAGKLAEATIFGVAELLEPREDSRPASPQDSEGHAESFSWSISRSGGDLPVISGTSADSGRHVSFPTSPYWNDATWLNPASPQPPSSFLETLSLGLQSVRTIEGLMTVIIHPHISGRPGFAETVVRFVDEAIGSGDVWIPRASELADWWRKRQTDPSEAE